MAASRNSSAPVVLGEFELPGFVWQCWSQGLAFCFLETGSDMVAKVGLKLDSHRAGFTGLSPPRLGRQESVNNVGES